MDEQRIKGTAQKAKGAVEEAAGKLTGNTRLQADGMADKVEGNVRDAVGKAKDAGRDALNEAKKPA